jgi:hypothetical protein
MYVNKRATCLVRETLTVAIIGRVQTNSVETLVPALDGLEILLPVGLPLAGAVSPVGANAETLVGTRQGLTSHRESHRKGAECAEELHSELKIIGKENN